MKSEKQMRASIAGIRKLRVVRAWMWGLMTIYFTYFECKTKNFHAWLSSSCLFLHRISSSMFCYMSVTTVTFINLCLFPFALSSWRLGLLTVTYFRSNCTCFFSINSDKTVIVRIRTSVVIFCNYWSISHTGCSWKTGNIALLIFFLLS